MSAAVWLRGGKADGRLQVLVEVPGRGWVVAINERWPGGEEEISHVCGPLGIEGAPVDKVSARWWPTP